MSLVGMPFTNWPDQRFLLSQLEGSVGELAVGVLRQAVLVSGKMGVVFLPESIVTVLVPRFQ